MLSVSYIVACNAAKPSMLACTGYVHAWKAVCDISKANTSILYCDSLCGWQCPALHFVSCHIIVQPLIGTFRRKRGMRRSDTWLEHLFSRTAPSLEKWKLRSEGPVTKSLPSLVMISRATILFYIANCFCSNTHSGFEKLVICGRVICFCWLSICTAFAALHAMHETEYSQVQPKEKLKIFFLYVWWYWTVWMYEASK